MFAAIQQWNTARLADRRKIRITKVRYFMVFALAALSFTAHASSTLADAIDNVLHDIAVFAKGLTLAGPVAGPTGQKATLQPRCISLVATQEIGVATFSSVGETMIVGEVPIPTSRSARVALADAPSRPHTVTTTQAYPSDANVIGQTSANGSAVSLPDCKILAAITTCSGRSARVGPRRLYSGVSAGDQSSPE
jgi:hypothetical protein